MYLNGIYLILAKCDCYGHFRYIYCCEKLENDIVWMSARLNLCPTLNFVKTNYIHIQIFFLATLIKSYLYFKILSCFLHNFENDDISLQFIFIAFVCWVETKYSFMVPTYLHCTKLNQRVGMKRHMSGNQYLL